MGKHYSSLLVRKTSPNTSKIHKKPTTTDISTGPLLHNLNISSNPSSTSFNNIWWLLLHNDINLEVKKKSRN
jgi:hypothetical protein